MSTATSGRRADGLLELAELAVDARQVADDLGQPHHRHIFGADHALQAGRGHALAAHAEEPAVCPEAASCFLSAAISSAP
jgi:asparagine synthetase B (glutamine-hydrolysing)